MPAKNGKDGKQLKQKYAVFVGGMVGPKTKATMAKVLSAGMTNAKENAPLEYGVLINSAFRRIEGSKELGWRGICGFTASYAYYLHGDQSYTPLWKPVAPENKEGPGWNPFATPRFLELGFIGPLAKEDIQRIIQQGYKI
jgi:hypothetical protein